MLLGCKKKRLVLLLVIAYASAPAARS